VRVLVVSSVFPNAKQPTFGNFVHARVAQLARQCGVVVVAPVPWFPWNRRWRGEERSGIKAHEQQGDLTVYHPKFLSFPGVLKCLDGLLYFLSVLWQVRRLRRQFPFDLIDAHFAYPDGVAACLLSRVFRRPVTVTIRGTLLPLSRYRLRRMQAVWALRNATRIFSVSESLKELAMSLGVPGDKIRVIPNGVDTNTFHPRARGEARAELGLPEGRPTIVSVASLCLRKGHQRVLEALPEVARQYPDVLYVVVGGPDLEGNTGPLLVQLTRDLGLAQNVRLSGARPHTEIPRWLAAADVFCLATSNEGRANVVMEALACGIPVVTTRVGGNAEVVEPGRNGFLVPVDDTRALSRALIAAIDADWDRETIARPWRARSWKSTAADVLEEFRMILREPATSGPAAVRAPEGGR
jgi:teichuronic acid biosynthesis glycosyltransferase TuaC